LRKIEKFKQSFPYISVGPDPVVDNISENYLLENLRRTNQPIKHLLLDQKIISGIGNIYVSEILFCSKVNPNKLSKEVSLDECREIIKNSKLIMKDAIESKGTSVVDFRSPFGRGSYQKKLRVYMREKEKCYDCGSFITMKKIKERSSFFCPECQK
jgi:formamidopyrimidine-DNA glycosylase